MSSRERWTVYPLLFMTLGIAIHDKLFRVVNVDTVVCRTLFVTDRSMLRKVEVASTPAGGFMRFPGKERGVEVGHLNLTSGNFAGLGVFDSRGRLIPGSSISAPIPHAPPGLAPPGEAEKSDEAPPEKK